MKSRERNHTPGPWNQEYDGAVVMAGQVIAGPSELCPDGSTRVQKDANARLIATSPTMFELLISASDFCELTARHCPKLSDIAETLYENIEKVLDRAEGKVSE